MVKKCLWCGLDSEHLIKLYEVHGDRVSDPLIVCRKHLIPGDDPCPVKQYKLREDGDQIMRIWLENGDLQKSISERYSWFEDHPNEITR